jgi:hypothetical protein
MRTRSAVRLFALAVLMPILILAFAVAPAMACSDQHPTDQKSTEFCYVDNVRINNLTIDLYQLQLTPEQLAMLNATFPLADLLASGVQYIYLDGMAHINLMAKEKCDKLFIDLHINWHGTIALLDQSKNVVSAVHSKCLQICAHATITKVDNNYSADLWLNIHTNSMYRCGCQWRTSILKLHVILNLSGSDVDMIKAQLSQLANAAAC